MTEHGVTEWTEDLRRFAAARRAARPLPDRSTLTPAQEWQCRIVGGAPPNEAFVIRESRTRTHGSLGGPPAGAGHDPDMQGRLVIEIVRA